MHRQDQVITLDTQVPTIIPVTLPTILTCPLTWMALRALTAPLNALEDLHPHTLMDLLTILMDLTHTLMAPRLISMDLLLALTDHLLALTGLPWALMALHIGWDMEILAACLHPVEWAHLGSGVPLLEECSHQVLDTDLEWVHLVLVLEWGLQDPEDLQDHTPCVLQGWDRLQGPDPVTWDHLGQDLMDHTQDKAPLLDRAQEDHLARGDLQDPAVLPTVMDTHLSLPDLEWGLHPDLGLDPGDLHPLRAVQAQACPRPTWVVPLQASEDPHPPTLWGLLHLSLLQVLAMWVPHSLRDPLWEIKVRDPGCNSLLPRPTQPCPLPSKILPRKLRKHARPHPLCPLQNLHPRSPHPLQRRKKRSSPCSR